MKTAITSGRSVEAVRLQIREVAKLINETPSYGARVILERHSERLMDDLEKMLHGIRRPGKSPQGALHFSLHR